MRDTKRMQSYRLTEQTIREIDELAEFTGASKAEVVANAVSEMHARSGLRDTDLNATIGGLDERQKQFVKSFATEIAEYIVTDEQAQDVADQLNATITVLRRMWF